MMREGIKVLDDWDLNDEEKIEKDKEVKNILEKRKIVRNEKNGKEKKMMEIEKKV